MPNATIAAAKMTLLVTLGRASVAFVFAGVIASIYRVWQVRRLFRKAARQHGVVRKIPSTGSRFIHL
jgi:hypothetical protein